MRISAAGATDIGRTRTSNEDSYLLDPSRQLYAVADGMGGHRAGEVASATAIEALRLAYRPGESLDAAIEQANQAVVEKAATDCELTGMGTTLTAVGLEADRAVIAHVGDSRAYLLRDGGVIRVTEDHSLVEQYVREGRLTPEQAEVHPQRSVITRALGIDRAVVVDRYEVDLRHGDRLLICSDGLTTMVREPQIATLLGSQDDPQLAARALVAAANDAGGDDNITVVVIDFAGEGSSRQATARPIAAAGAGPSSHAPAPVPPSDDDVPLSDSAVRVDPPDERKGRRRRRLRRKRHPVRVVLLSLPVVAVVAAGIGILAWYARGTFYVGAADERVAVFRGVSGGLLGWKPTVERRSALSLGELTDAERVAVEDESRYADLEEALRYVALLESAVRSRRASGSSEQLASPPNTGPTTSTAPSGVYPAQPASSTVTSAGPAASEVPRR
ncbi:MAG: Stp1/IreP family PP2C-type Ser/Thr phosphatase [Acidimicrobiia bacterium]